MIAAEPFLKWAGGKRSLRARLLPLFPDIAPSGTYYEPFLGGAAVFFALAPERAQLSDVNGELIEVYQTVRDSVLEVIDALAALPYSADDYYRIRSSRPSDAVGRAARFVYLNKTCFNGLYRVNQSGAFNVPFGRHGPNLEICDRDQLLAASACLAAARICALDFEEAVAGAQAGDLVYCDPPYTTAHSNNGFVEYNARVFSWEDQRRLAQVVTELVDRGVSVVVSNGDHPSIIECFSCAKLLNLTRIDRWSTIAGKSAKRFQTSELVFVGRGREVASCPQR